MRLALSLTDEENTPGKKIDASLYYRNGSYYLSMTQFADSYHFTTTGDRSAIRYILDVKTEENVVVRPGSRMVKVNGTEIMLKDRCIRDESGVWLPLSFFTGYLNGLQISVGSDSDEAVVLSVRRIAESSDASNGYLPLSFRIRSPIPCDPVPPVDLSVS